jgi:hypothetical protein
MIIVTDWKIPYQYHEIYCYNYYVYCYIQLKVLLLIHTLAIRYSML